MCSSAPCYLPISLIPSVRQCRSIMKTLAQIELFEPADVKSTQFLLAIKFDSSRLWLSRFYKSRSALFCYGTLLAWSFGLSGWTGYCYKDFPSQYWFLSTLAALYLAYILDIVLRCVASGRCGFVGFVDSVVVFLNCAGACLGFVSTRFALLGISSVLLSSYYPAKQLLLVCIESKCRSDLSELRMNESYSIEDTPREDRYIEDAPGESKASEV
mmetsp:Transcript_14558/g.27097  ORF Transcript_14558/g.27097 Transcript_14558/m.27097 type:complete len:214 (-) Transcript_14558:213-854(-)